MDKDGSGELCITELQMLISSLGVTPFKATLKEAMSVVDIDGSNQLDFDEFVCLMAVYRVTEGFTRNEVQQLKALFDRVAVVKHDPLSGPCKELQPDRLFDVMVSMFGPQSNNLAKKLAKRFATGDHSDPKAELNHNTQHIEPDVEHGLPFPEFLLWARRLREAEVEEFRKEFLAADSNKNGKIETGELRDVITGIGYMPLQTMITEVMNKVDLDGDGGLDFDEFVNLMAVFRLTDGFCAAEIAEFEDVFERFKAGSDGLEMQGMELGDDESVDSLELIDMLRSMGYVARLDDVRRFIKEVDFDNSNTLDVSEFVRLMRIYREEELAKAREAFNRQRDHLNRQREHSEFLDSDWVGQTLIGLGYKPTEAMLEEAMTTLINVEAGQEKPPEEVDFDQFVAVMDMCRKALQLVRRTFAAYSDKEVQKYQKAFDVYDEDGSGDVEKMELTNLLRDVGIQMNTKEQQEAMLEQLDVARSNAIKCGVDKKQLGNMGDPSVTFTTLLFLLRMLHTTADIAEVDATNKMLEQTRFTPKEAEEFRGIFNFWSQTSAALEGGLGSSEEAGDLCEENAKKQYLTKDGINRVVRSLGLPGITTQDKRDLDERIAAGPFSTLRPGKFGFFEFLLFMRWMLDTNFGHINEAMAEAAAAAA